MKYICAQPATLYYAWQIDTMLFSFVNVGINLEDVHIVCAIHGDIHDHFNVMMQKYPGVNFSFYKDERTNKSYIPSIRPHILKKHFRSFRSLSEERIMYHDSDIAFTKPIKWESFLDDSTCFLSDTKSYIGYNYIKSKGDDVLHSMLESVGIDEDTVKANQDSSGGAQYVLNGVDEYFWYDVEKDSVALFNSISDLNKIKKEQDPTHHEIQIWCADMWAVLWSLWKRKRQTKIVDELDFSWATSDVKEWHKSSIYHNAGVTEDHNDLFYKGNYLSAFPDLNLNISEKSNSYNYYSLVKQALL